MNYLELGYNQFLERNPYLEASRYSAIEVKELFPIGSISLDRISGGTLVLGGLNNIKGTVSVQNEAGTEIATIDSSGIV